MKYKVKPTGNSLHIILPKKDGFVAGQEVEIKSPNESHYLTEDKVIVADAHQFLLEHFEEFDFIWSSPPCPTHTRFNNLKYEQRDKGFKLKYPDMKLWQEIIVLNKWFKGKWVVENVKTYYDFILDGIEPKME